MTQYISCRGCLVDRHKCEHRKSIQAAIKGLQVTSIKFSCKQRIARFTAGQRVAVMWKFETGDGYYGSGIEEVQFKATVLGEPKPGRFHIKVDDGPCYFCEDDPTEYIAPDCLIGNGYATATYSRLSALDEPHRAVCPECGGLGDESDCWFSSLASENCLRNRAKARGES